MNMLQENKILLDIPSHYKIVHSHISKSPPLIEVTVSQMLPTPSRLLKKLVVRSNFSMFAMAANGEMGGDPRCMCGIRYIVASYSTLRTDSSRCGQNLRDANEIVGGGGKDKKPRDQLPSAMTGLTQTADGLHPAERFLDPLALLHADGIARMAGRARVDRRAAVCIVLRHMWHSATFAAPGDEIGGVVIL